MFFLIKMEYRDGIKIYDPNIIKNKDYIIILKNGYYTNEILNQINELNINTEVII